MSRRGPYHQYLRCTDEYSRAKIPKQTKCNRKKKVLTVIFCLQNYCVEEK